MSITSKIDICNMTINLLGSVSSIADIDAPTDPRESVFALWYDVARQTLLRTYTPNFAKFRLALPLLSDQKTNGYEYGYQIPKDCLLVQGVGTLDEKKDNYSIEGGVLYTNEIYEEGCPARCIMDMTDITKWPTNAQVFLAWTLAEYVVWPITQDKDKVNFINAMLPRKASEFTSVNAMENKPVLVSNSLFRQARYAYEGRVDRDKK